MRAFTYAKLFIEIKKFLISGFSLVSEENARCLACLKSI